MVQRALTAAPRLRRAAGVRPRAGSPGISAEAKLALVEGLSAAGDHDAVARLAMEWLGAHSRIPRGVCAWPDAEARMLVGLSGFGIRRERIEQMALPMDDRTLPLVDALFRKESSFFPDGRALRARIFEGPFLVLPLRSASWSEDHAAGLLMVATPARKVSPDLAWFAKMLAERLSDLHSRRTLGESRLVRERALLHSIINTVTDPILLTDLEGKLIMANSRAEKLFIAGDEDSEGRRRAVAMNNMLYSSSVASHVMQGGEPARNELVLVDPIEGSDLLFELLSSVVTDPAHGTGVVSILRNVTDLGHATMELHENLRKLRVAEADARAERHRLDLIIDSVADPIVVTDPAGDIVLMNAPAEALFTVSPNAGVGSARRVQTNDAHFSSFVANLMFSGTEGRHRGEVGLVDPTSGNVLPVEAVAGKVLSEQGELIAVVTILHDQTEAREKARLYEQLKKASEELQARVQAATAELAEQNELLRRQAIELEQASALKTQFLANMSHEFRTPLNAVLGYTQILLQGVDGELKPAQRKSLARVDSNGRHLLMIVNEILDISRIEAGRMPLNIAEFGLPQLIAEVIAELEPMITRSKLPVHTVLPQKLPVLSSDRQKVKQILVNLLSNALKFTHQGSVTVTAAVPKGSRAIDISVADTGIGIAGNDRDKVFEDFRQVDPSPARQYAGTGLGLAICRRLATLLGGKITLDSVLGRGSTFMLHIPVRLKR